LMRNGTIGYVLWQLQNRLLSKQIHLQTGRVFNLSSQPGGNLPEYTDRLR
jgi:hypothetical protein